MDNVKPGDRIRLIVMPDDPLPIEPGTTGTVTNVTTGVYAQIDVDWDNGRTLCLIPGTDQYEVISKPNQRFQEFSGCPRCGNWVFDTVTTDDTGRVVSCDACGWKGGSDENGK